MKKIILGIIMLGLFNIGFANEETENLLIEGKYQVEIENYKEGAKYLDAYLKTNRDPEAYVYFARAQRELGNLTASNNTAKKAQGKYPENTEIVTERLLTVDKLYENETASPWRKGKYLEEYYTVFEHYLVMTNYENSEKIFHLGNKYFMDNLYEKSRDTFLKDRNGDIKNLFGAATTTRFLGDYRRSVGLYTQVLNIDPNFYEAYLGRGSAYQLSGDLNRGIKDMEKYLEYKKDVDVYIAIANMYMSLERYSSAKSVLERASGNYPSSQEVRDLLVEVYSKLKR